MEVRKTEGLLIRMMKIRRSMLFVLCHKAHPCIEILTYSLECCSIAICQSHIIACF